MRLLDKFLDIMRLNSNEDEDYYDDEYFDDEDEIDVPKPKKAASSRAGMEEDDYGDRVSKKTQQQAKITPMRQPITRKVSAGSGMEVCVIKPTSVEEAREITETLLANRTVVLNLEGLDVDIAQRIIDFTSGSCFAIDGNLQKISHYIFIITPASVDISGDFQDILTGNFESSLQSDL